MEVNVTVNGEGADRGREVEVGVGDSHIFSCFVFVTALPTIWPRGFPICGFALVFDLEGWSR